MVLHYQITVAEQLDKSWSSWFDGLSITHGADGTTTLEGRMSHMVDRPLVWHP